MSTCNINVMWEDLFTQNLMSTPLIINEDLISFSDLLARANLEFQAQSQYLFLQQMMMEYPNYDCTSFSPFIALPDHQDVIEDQQQQTPIENEELQQPETVHEDIPSNIPNNDFSEETMTIIPEINLGDESDSDETEENDHLTRNEIKHLPTKVFATKKISKERLKANQRKLDYDAMSTQEYSSDCLCSICLNSYKPKEKLIILSCKHSFHKKCISRWLIRVSRCPLCKCNQKGQLEDVSNNPN